MSKPFPQRTITYPEKILQFGEGNFLRAFTDWMVDKANDAGVYSGSIVLCQPIENGLCESINEQNGAYTLVMRGLENAKPIERIKKIDSVSRCINPYKDFGAFLEIARSKDLEVVVSNTTEAGISFNEADTLTDSPPASFPAKVCVLLYERYKSFDGDPSRGLLFLPVELIDDNGARLKEIIIKYAEKWGLEENFIEWVDKHNNFCSTLVDRIVTGYPWNEAEEFVQKLGYDDKLLVTSELFNLWVIEGDSKYSDILPIHKTDANVIWTNDVSPYKKRKVRILNGAHTASVLAAFLAGHDVVLDMMNDEVFDKMLDRLIFDEIIPTIDLPEKELLDFAYAVKERFSNPYIKHRLLDISLNSCSKWQARCMPSFLDYIKLNGKLPTMLTFSLAAFIQFYKGTKRHGAYFGKRFDAEEYQIKDDDAVIEFFDKVWREDDLSVVADLVLGNTQFWNGTDLRKIDGLKLAVSNYLHKMEQMPIKDILTSMLC